MADRSKCPSCGSRVSPYAAGCATCGADLDTKRWDAGPSRSRQLASLLSSVSVGAIPAWAVWTVVLAAVVIAYGLI